jgi:NTP pyrophosphatase (non-canonical NTP hydrolase)
MTLKEYQEKAMTTCMKSSENFSYMFLNLVGEVGELASKVAKGIRKGNMYIGEGENDNALYHTDFPEMVEQENEMMKEAGDILWQLSGLCSVMGWSLERIAEINLEKLSSRQKRNVIDGNGDNR